jgi:hypothetical protein
MPRASRYLVPDLSPRDRPQARSFRPKVLFVAESPHVQEVTPEQEPERRPLCGTAGRVWWAELSELLEGRKDDDVSLSRLLSFCERHGVAVMNAVQLPLDPKITRVFPEADPLKQIGFSKEPGPRSYKKQKGKPELERVLDSLRARLNEESVRALPIVALGNDSEWFLRQALSPEEAEERLIGKLPHPSAWWRRGGLYGRQAHEKLQEIFRKIEGRTGVSPRTEADVRKAGSRG